MSHYFAAYVVFWAALFAYLVGMTRRQARLVQRATRLVERLTIAGGSAAPPSIEREP